MSDELHHSDPLLNSAEVRARELYNALGACCQNYNSDTVIAATMGILVNTLRSTYGKKDQVENRFDELWRLVKGRLLRYYDPVTNRRRSDIQFTQVIGAPFVKADDNLFRGPKG